MKKVISVLLALALSLMMLPAFAEGADYTGTWYIQRGVSGEETLDVVDPEGITLELREDGTFVWHEDLSESGEDMLFEWLAQSTCEGVQMADPWRDIPEAEAERLLR